MEIERADLKTNVRADLADRGLTNNGTGDGPLAPYLPMIAGGTYEVITPYRMGLVMAEAHQTLDALERVQNIFVCDEYSVVGMGLARMYPILRRPGGKMRYEWLGLEHPYAIGFVWSGHGQCLAYTTEGTMFWEPQADGGWLMAPQPYGVRPGHWGIWNIVF
jgi:hypothetical protein